MTNPIDEERVGTVMRDLLASGQRPAAPVTAAEVRNRAQGKTLRRVDSKVIVALVAVAAVIVTLIVVGPLRSSNGPAHPPAGQPGSTTSSTTTPSTTVPVTIPAGADAALAAYMATERAVNLAAAAQAPAAANALVGQGFVSEHSPAEVDDGMVVAVAAFTYDPAGQPVQVLQYRKGQWSLLAGLPTPYTGDGYTVAASVALLTPDPIAVADATGDGRPDFLITGQGGDNVPGFVVSDAGGVWHYVAFSGPYATPPTDILDREPRFVGTTLASDYNSCVPDCAAAPVTTIVWSYDRSTGDFTAPYPAGYTGVTTTVPVAPAAATRQVQYQPFTAQGAIEPSLHVTATLAAQTYVGSGVAGTSSDRCFTASGTIYDPCFAAPVATSGPLLCPSNPADSDVVELTISSLPASDGGPVTRPWAMQLASGQVCLQINAAWGDRGPFGCQAPGGLADCHTPVAGVPAWTASCQSQETDSAPFTPEDVVTLWS
jgi:hypothetical protein